MSDILTNLQAVRRQITHAAQMAGRSVDEIQLVAVSKTVDAKTIVEAAMAGQYAFGENYLQEALDKIAEVRQFSPELVLEWHFIGPIQRNKTRLITQNFSWLHGVDRLMIAERLSAQRPDNLPPLNICIQINISEEETKSGVPLSQAAQLAQQIAVLPHLRLRGFMVIPEPVQDLHKTALARRDDADITSVQQGEATPPGQVCVSPETQELQRIPYHQINLLQKQLNQQGLALDTLSMGMSADLEAAILEGSTLVRVGTAIFGARDYV